MQLHDFTLTAKRHAVSCWNWCLNMIHDIESWQVFCERMAQTCSLILQCCEYCADSKLKCLWEFYVCKGHHQGFQHHPENGVSILMVPSLTTATWFRWREAYLGHGSSHCLGLSKFSRCLPVRVRLQCCERAWCFDHQVIKKYPHEPVHYDSLEFCTGWLNHCVQKGPL